MHLSTLVAALSLAGTGLAVPAPKEARHVPAPAVQVLHRRAGASIAQKTNTTSIAPKRFIVEFDKTSDPTALASQLASRPGTKVLRVFDTDVFKGASLEASLDSSDTLLASAAPVRQVWKSSRIKLAKSQPSKLFGSGDGAAAGNYSIHWSTGVDKLHAQGITGKGATVAIVDTGTWYTHPALGGGFGAGYKVKGGADLVGDGFWPDFGDKLPDSDPLDGHGHGTHVAGIVAGKTDFWTGVAPDAELLSYKVFSNSDGTDEDTLIAAFLEAYKADADVITASIGGPSGFAENAWAVVASRLVESGTVVTIAAGNEGEIGPFFGSNGAAGKLVLAVASVEASTLPGEPFKATFSGGNGTTAAPNTITAAYLPSPDVWLPEVKDWPVWPVSLNASDPLQGCAELAGASVPDLSQKIPLVRVGGCATEDKQAVLEAHGAKYVLFYNDESPLQPPYSWDWSSSIGLLTADTGKAMVDALAAGQTVTVDFSADFGSRKVGMFNSGGGVPSYFTTYGALYDLSVKPDVAAPGGDIWSTYLNDQYAIMSGTSMATPYVAGVAALYVGKTGGKKAKGAAFAKEAIGRIASSGAALPWSVDGTVAAAGSANAGFYAPVDQVGTGMVRADKAVGYATGLSYAKFALNDTHHFERYQKVDVTNAGTAPVEYRFSAQPAGGYEALSCAGCGVKYGADVTPLAIVPKIDLPGGKFVLNPGETRTAQVNFEYPTTGFSAENVLPVYSGKILVTGSNGESLSVPYFGLATDLEKQMTKIFAEGYPQSVSGVDWTDISVKSNYTFNLTLDAQDFPRLFVSNNWGVNELRWDIFDATWNERDWVYPPVVGKAGYVGSATGFANAEIQYSFDPSRDDANNTFAFPVHQEWRTPSGYYHEFWWLGKFADGTQVKPGTYQMRVAALAPFGTPEHSDNWDIFAHTFTVTSA